jgi:predicted transcriptional regulator
VRKSRSALQGLRILNKYFTTSERLTLITSFFYSRLYYGSQVWLIPSLKRALKSKLFSASGAALKLLDKDMSFKDLHKKYNRATPTQFQKYTTAISLYDLIKKEIPEDDWINLQFNIQNDRRNTKLSFQANNRFKCGLNCLSNRFKSITNEIDKQWIDMTRDVYKTKCKRRLITEKLLLL